MLLKLFEYIVDDNNEFDHKKYTSIVDDFGIKRPDDFLSYWVAFLYKYPLPNKLKRVFDKQDLNGKIGICSKHLIKVAKEKNVDQFMIDHYVESKNDRNFWYYIYGSTHSDDGDDLIYSEINKYAYDKKIRSEARKIMYKHILNKITFRLITEVLTE